MLSVFSLTMAVSSLIYYSLLFCTLISEVIMANSFLIFSITISVYLLISTCWVLTTSCFLYYLFSFWISFFVVLIFSASVFIDLSMSLIDFSLFMISILSWPRTIYLPLIIFLMDSMAVPTSSVIWKVSSFSFLSWSICSFCCSIFSLKVVHIFSFLSISYLKSFSSFSIPTISMLRFSALLA